jgi:hypothetical protein
MKIENDAKRGMMIDKKKPPHFDGVVIVQGKGLTF